MEFMKPKKCETCLRFTPYAWAKLLYLRDAGNTEIAAFGITETDDPMLVTDLLTIKQKCTAVSFEFEDNMLIDFMEKMLDKGLAPWQCQNILIHTHPGNCAKPSSVDEENFKKYFQDPSWSIFYILANGGDEYCRMIFNTGPGVNVEIKSKVDFYAPFKQSNIEEWKKEYKQNIKEAKSEFKFNNIEKYNTENNCNPYLLEYERGIAVLTYKNLTLSYDPKFPSEMWIDKFDTESGWIQEIFEPKTKMEEWLYYKLKEYGDDYYEDDFGADDWMDKYDYNKSLDEEMEEIIDVR